MNTRKMYKRGVRQPWLDKMTYGVLFVVLLLIILLFPLAIFSSFSFLTRPSNPVVGVSASLRANLAPHAGSVADGATDPSGSASLYGAFPLGTISRFELETLSEHADVLAANFGLSQCLDAPHQNTSMCGYAYLLGDWSVQYQRVRFARETDLQWQINVRAPRRSPPRAQCCLTPSSRSPVACSCA